MSDSGLYVGIDVAMAKRKRIPVAFLLAQGDGLALLPARTHEATRNLLPPRGMGNAALVRDLSEADRYADLVAEFITRVATAIGAPVKAVAIDAPADFRPLGVASRRAEAALADEGLSYFKTPSRLEFESHLAAARRHLDSGGTASHLPAANLFWMLVGFALFRRLPSQLLGVPILEVYPQATFWALDAATAHKSSADGLVAQSQALAAKLVVDRHQLVAALPTLGHGKGHDLVDALSAAWVAALPDSERQLLGESVSDGIWIPRRPLRPTS